MVAASWVGEREPLDAGKSPGRFESSRPSSTRSAGSAPECVIERTTDGSSGLDVDHRAVPLPSHVVTQPDDRAVDGSNVGAQGADVSDPVEAVAARPVVGGPAPPPPKIGGREKSPSFAWRPIIERQRLRRRRGIRSRSRPLVHGRANAGGRGWRRPGGSGAAAATRSLGRPDSRGPPGRNAARKSTKKATTGVRTARRRARRALARGARPPGAGRASAAP